MTIFPSLIAVIYLGVSSTTSAQELVRGPVAANYTVKAESNGGDDSILLDVFAPGSRSDTRCASVLEKEALQRSSTEEWCRGQDLNLHSQ